MSNDLKHLNVVGHMGVNATASVTKEGVISLELALRGEKRVAEFRTLMTRALNTYDSPEPWMYDLADALEQKLPPPGA